jgi:hypothetical protein
VARAGAAVSRARPRLLLVPFLTELEWLIKPQLEEWADVATFDAPGVGDEPSVEHFGREAVARRGLHELERRSWDDYVLVADGSGIATALRIARNRPDAVAAAALGHARLSDEMEGERPPRNREVFEAVGSVLQVDYGNFVRHALVQATHGSIRDELVQQILGRVPENVGKAAWAMVTEQEKGFGDTLRQLGVPLLFARHEGCLGETDEGFADAVTAFPEARTVSVPEAPSVSAEFAHALRSFARDAWGSGADAPTRG